MFELFENLENITDSMQFDSETCICRYLDDRSNYKVTVEVRGEVQVDWNPEGIGNLNATKTTERFFRPSEFPDKLKALITKGTDNIGLRWTLDERVCVLENNWFEMFISKHENGSDYYLDSCEIDAKSLTAEQLEKECKDYLHEYLKKLSDAVKVASDNNIIIRLYDIDWDTDGEDVELPKEVIIRNPDDDLIEGFFSGYDDELADYLSDEYGFCVGTFRSERLFGAGELADAWRHVVEIYDVTRDKTPEYTAERICSASGMDLTKQVFAAVGQIKKSDGRIYGKEREYVNSITVDPEAVEWKSDNPLIRAGLDDIHTTHIAQIIEAIMKYDKG